MEIRTFAKLIEVLTLQKNNLGTYLVQVNATAADVTEVTNELANLTAMNTYADIADGYKKMMFEIKQALYDGDLLTPIPAFPPNITPPALLLPLAGALTRTRDRNRRFKAAAGYTAAIGDALGISDDPTPLPDPSNVVPKINVFAAKSGYEFSVVVTDREQADSWRVDAIPVATGVRAAVGTATGKSADFVYHPPAGTTGPIQIRIEVQLRKNNADYGHPSAEERITVNP